MYGKPVTGVERTTLVISPDTGSGQRLLHVYAKVKPEGHADEVLALLEDGAFILKLRTEASTRFEKSLPSAMADVGAARGFFQSHQRCLGGDRIAMLALGA